MSIRAPLQQRVLALAETDSASPSVLFFLMTRDPGSPWWPRGHHRPAVTGLIGIPLAFIVIGVVLALFSVGYVAMARHVVNAGAFYALHQPGLSRPLGSAARGSR